MELPHPAADPHHSSLHTRKLCYTRHHKTTVHTPCEVAPKPCTQGCGACDWRVSGAWGDGTQHTTHHKTHHAVLGTGALGLKPRSAQALSTRHAMPQHIVTPTGHTNPPACQTQHSLSLLPSCLPPQQQKPCLPNSSPCNLQPPPQVDCPPFPLAKKTTPPRSAKAAPRSRLLLLLLLLSGRRPGRRCRL